MDYEVAVIIPTFNAAKKIHKSLDSLVKQEFKNFEVLVFDGNSSDSTREIVASYSERINIRVINNKNDKGPASARALGISHSKSKYIAFCDADDIWLPKKLSTQHKFMQTNDSSFSYTKIKIYNVRRKQMFLRKVKKKYSFNDYLSNRGIVCSTVMVKRDLCTEDIISIQLPHSGEDTLWWQLMMKKHDVYALLASEDPLVIYAHNDGGLSAQYRFSTIFQQYKNLSYLDNMGMFKKLYLFISYLINTFMLNIITTQKIVSELPGEK